MRSPRSSSRNSSEAQSAAEPPQGARPLRGRRAKLASGGTSWYREPWPWFLIAGPLAVVIACMVTTVIAVRSDDGVVAGDYYKRGLLVNQRLPKGGAATPHYAATVALGVQGEVDVHPEASDPPGNFLRVTLYHPASGARETLSLRRTDAGAFAGTLAQSRAGRWIVSVESASWPLPTTVVERGASVRVATSTAIR